MRRVGRKRVGVGWTTLLKGGLYRVVSKKGAKRADHPSVEWMMWSDDEECLEKDMNNNQCLFNLMK